MQKTVCFTLAIGPRSLQLEAPLIRSPGSSGLPIGPPPHLANTTNIQSFYYENLLISVVLGCGRCQPQPFTPTFAATPPPPSQPAPPQCSRTMFQPQSNATFFRPQPHHPVKTTHIQRFYYENQLIFVVLGCEGCNPQPSRFPQDFCNFY